ncbi:MAG: alanine--tRNA ligase [Sphingomonadales bacterium]
MANVNDIRETFLNYFQKNDHTLVKSSGLVPNNDPTLMFTNAGMVQFKNVLTGGKKLGFDKAVSSQKCVRAGGKHNDLDNVGYTVRHHTFFEMLGNFSFGDYFKEEAIFYAWDLITREYGINPSKLMATVYHEDDEAFELWRKISGLPEDHIIRIASQDNFWAMGDKGPCGPCSEIFYDHGDHISGGPPGSLDEDGDRFVEIWNLVFMQYDQIDGSTRENLPKPSIDTGMGLERIAAVLQGTNDNYEIDSFKSLINASQNETGVKAVGEASIAHRVISDHLRASSFLISDGVLPSNDGRGYVLRRIMRRAMRYAHMLGYKDLLMHLLVPTLVSEMGQAYPELRRAEPLITETLKLEEGRFKETLERGLKLLGDEISKIGASEPLSGEVAFKLYDTYGFPVDLTEDVLRRQNREVDILGFNEAMKKQKDLARANWSGTGSIATKDVWFNVYESHGATDFIGYDTLDAEGQILALLQSEECVEAASKGDEVTIIANQSPFYGESGGQMGDSGIIKTQGGAIILITDTQKVISDLHLHIGVVKSGHIEVNEFAEFHVDGNRRNKLRANHSATHLLHEALRVELGDHVTQKGSLVRPNKLRFDFSHQKPLSQAELSRVEVVVNEKIRENTEVSTRLMTPDSAIEAGAMALFGEKYGEEVRVVSMANNFSIELCGGTHVERTGDIGLIKIVGESAVSSGVRRIEALVGEEARQAYLDKEKLLNDAAINMKVTPDTLPDRVKLLVKEKRNLEKALANAKKELAMLDVTKSHGPEYEEINGVKFLGQILMDVSPGDLRGLADEAKTKLGSGVIVLITVKEEKAAILIGVTDDLTPNFNAVDFVKIGAKILGGKGGGGRPDMAQAGGPFINKAEEAILAIKTEIGQ